MTIEEANLIFQAFIAGSAVIALYQIIISKNNFQTNSRRESVKYGTELVDDYLNKVIPATDNVIRQMTEKHFKKYGKAVDLRDFTRDEALKKGKELSEDLYRSVKFLGDNEPLFRETVFLANRMESFATPFIEAVADEKVAFRAIGLDYCNSIKRFYFLYCTARHDTSTESSYFPNSIELYNLWNDRIKRLKLVSIETDTKKALEDTPERFVKPIGS